MSMLFPSALSTRISGSKDRRYPRITSKKPLKTDKMMISSAVPMVIPPMLIPVRTEIRDTCFLEKRYRRDINRMIFILD
jgi:hypothetical protein